MKTLLTTATILVAAALFGADEDVNVESYAIQNVIGVQKVVSDKEYTPLAVCFGATAVSANAPVNVARPATNLVLTANLVEGDQLFVYDHARKGYVAYSLDAEKRWQEQTVFSATNSAADLSPLDGQSQGWGYGFWLRRQNVASREDKTIYLVGQVPVGEVSISLAPSTASTFGKTLIGNPLGAAWDLNDKSVFDWSTVAELNDHIQLNDANATVYYWKKISSKPVVKYGWKCMTGSGDGVIPAGAAFWYVRAKPKAGDSTAQAPIVITFRTGL